MIASTERTSAGRAAAVGTTSLDGGDGGVEAADGVLPAEVAAAAHPVSRPQRRRWAVVRIVDIGGWRGGRDRPTLLHDVTKILSPLLALRSPG
jgi:hypothetical protein